MQKTALHAQELDSRYKRIKRRQRLLIFSFIILISLTFLLLLYPRPANLFVILLDISNSMAGSMGGGDGQTKIDVAKDSIAKLAQNFRRNDYVLLTTFGPGNCEERGLQWITANPAQCGGEIVVDIGNNKDLFSSRLFDIETIESNTHLSEAIHKTLEHIERSESSLGEFKYLEILVVGDGQDHCRAIELGDNVAALPWSFREKLKLNVVAVQVEDDEASSNLYILTTDGNGEYVDVYQADEFYTKLVDVSLKSSESLILITHLIIVLLSMIIFALALRTSRRTR